MSVVGPLPLLDVRVEVPPSSVAPQDEAAEPLAAPTPAAKSDGKPSTAAAEPDVKPISAVALKGQVLNWLLSLSNTGDPCMGSVLNLQTCMVLQPSCDEPLLQSYREPACGSRCAGDGRAR